MKKSTCGKRNPDDTTLTFQLPKSLREKVEAAASEDDRKTGAWLRKFVADHFEALDKNRGLSVVEAEAEEKSAQAK